MGILDDLRNQTLPKVEGLIWVSMLIKYDSEGHAEIVEHYVKPSKESAIKMHVKEKKKKKKIVFKSEPSTEATPLF